MNEINNLRMRLKEALDNLWARVKGMFDNLDERVTELEEGGGGSVTSVNGQTGAVVLGASDVSAKAVQTAVADPTASGNAETFSFIYSITQNAQGVISPTKKNVPTATTTSAGLMSAADKAKLNGLDMLGFYIDNSGYICQRIGSDT